MKNSQISAHASGNIYVMTHSLFSDVVKIGCTTHDPITLAASLSLKSPGQYSVFFYQHCNNPSKVKQDVQSYLFTEKYIDDFYQTSPTLAKKILRQETLRIPTLNMA